MIVFKNAGEIDPRSITTFGINVKENENPIGFFGTGLKYAIAVLLRERQKIIALAGAKAYKFTYKNEMVRGKMFEMIYMNDMPMGFTTDLGKNWEMWMAYRELACNTLDERGTVEELPDGKIDSAPGMTLFIVVGAEFTSIYRNRSQYILQDAPDFVEGTMSDLDIWNRPSQHFFYSGVRVAELGKPSLLTYSTRKRVDLTEDRTMKYQSFIGGILTAAFSQCTDKALLRRVLLAKDGTFEHELDFTFSSPCQEFYDVVGELAADHAMDINATAYERYKAKAKENAGIKELELTVVQEKTLQHAISFAKKLKFPVDDYPIRIASELGHSVLGYADSKNMIIWLSSKTFDKGAKQVVATLIEEWVHLKTGYKDCSRDLQDYFLERMLSMGEELIGSPI